jgi:hypothetical protein
MTHYLMGIHWLSGHKSKSINGHTQAVTHGATRGTERLAYRASCRFPGFGRLKKTT